MKTVYHCVSFASLESLQTEINIWISRGWKLQGSMSFDGRYYNQPITIEVSELTDVNSFIENQAKIVEDEFWKSKGYRNEITPIEKAAAEKKLNEIEVKKKLSEHTAKQWFIGVILLILAIAGIYGLLNPEEGQLPTDQYILAMSLILGIGLFWIYRIQVKKNSIKE